ncbi:hypothetical protein LTR94_035611, partial [Friedmanniomyces endolithicus]
RGRRRPLRARHGRPADRRADRAQGHLRHPRLAHHGRLEDAGRLRQPVRRDRRRPLQRGRHGYPGQGQPGRIRDGLGQRELGLWRGEEPVGRSSRAGRL